MIRRRWFAVMFLGMAMVASCHRGDDDDDTSGDEEEGTPIVRGSPRAELCQESGDQYVQMPYDTNGDGAPDVIRVYLITETANQNGSRLGRRIVCREADLNGDGVRDVVRIYDDQQRVAREQQDRDFDGRPDYWEIYENGQLLRVEEDANRDERIDTRIYMDMHGRPARIERDTAGRSAPGAWRADHYEFFSEGRLIRSGEDLDFDGRIDRWNRDRLFEADVTARECAATGECDAGVGDAESASDAGTASASASGSDAGIRDAGLRDAGVRATDASVRAMDASVRDGGVIDAGRPATSRP